MKTLARVTLFLRRLAALDPSFDKARTAAESALLSAIRANWITTAGVERVEALIKSKIEQMSIDDLAADVRESLSAHLVSLVKAGIEKYEFFNVILRKMPEEHKAYSHE